MGWEVTTGFTIATVGPIPESGHVPLTIAPHLGGQTIAMPMEPLSSESLAAWRGYSLEMSGWLAPDPEHPRDPVWRLFEDDGTPLHPLELHRIRVRAAGSDLYAELIALPIEGRSIRTGIFGWNESRPRRIPPPDEIEKAVHGLELLGLGRELGRELEAARHAGGMPGFYDDTNEHLFFDRLVNGVHEVVGGGDRVSLSSLKTRMRLDRRTIKRYVGEFRYDLTALEAEALRCTHGLSPCTVHVRRRSDFKKKRP